MNQTIKYAGVAGIFSLISAVPIMFFVILQSLNKLDGGLISLYIFFLLLSLVSYVIFIWGFKLIAERYQNNLLRIMCYILIISNILCNGYFIITLISPNLDSI